MALSRRKLLSTAGAIGALSLVGGLASFSRRALAAESSTKIRIGVIGAGWLGGTVAELWVKAGHQVMFSSRNLNEMKQKVKPLGENAHAGTPAEAAAFGEVVLFAVPYDAMPGLAKQLANTVKGKIVLDACNPPYSESDALSREAWQNGVGETTARLFPGARIVRAFNAVDATQIASSATRQSDKLGIPIASDDRQALQVVAQLVTDVGSVPVITGNLATAKKFQNGSDGFRANTDAAALRKILQLPAS